MKYKSAVLAASLLAFSLAARLDLADAPAPESATLKGDAARPEAAHWLRNELYFGVGSFDSPDDSVAEIRWQAFLDREVTPRFPDGLTVLDAYGQWRDHPKDAPSRAAIDAIRSAFKAETHDKSVLLATEHVDVSF